MILRKGISAVLAQCVPGSTDRARRPGDVGAETNRQRQGDRAACTGEFRGLRSLHASPARFDRASDVATGPLGRQHDDRRRLDRLRARCRLRRSRRHVRHAGRHAITGHTPSISTTSWVTTTHEHGPGKQSGQASVPAPRARSPPAPIVARAASTAPRTGEDGTLAACRSNRCRRRGGRRGSPRLQGRRRADRAQRAAWRTVCATPATARRARTAIVRRSTRPSACVRSMMAGLAWWKAWPPTRAAPLKRLAAAEYRLLGSLLGLTPGEAAESPATAGRASRRREACGASTAGSRAGCGSSYGRRSAVPSASGRLGDAPELAPGELAVVFYASATIDADAPRRRRLDRQGPTTLRVRTCSPAPPARGGRRSADRTATRSGIIEIVL